MVRRFRADYQGCGSGTFVDFHGTLLFSVAFLRTPWNFAVFPLGSVVRIISSPSQNIHGSTWSQILGAFNAAKKLSKTVHTPPSPTNSPSPMPLSHRPGRQKMKSSSIGTISSTKQRMKYVTTTASRLRRRRCPAVGVVAERLLAGGDRLNPQKLFQAPPA